MMQGYNNMDLRGAPQVTHCQFTIKVTPDVDGEEGEVGVQAVARLAIPIGGRSFHLVNIESGGLWGVDGDDAYIQEVYREGRGNLIAELGTLASDIVHGYLKVEGL